MNEELKLVENDVKAIEVVYQLFDNPNLNDEEIKKLEGLLIEYCKNVIKVLDKKEQTKNIEISNSLNKIIKTLVNQNDILYKLITECAKNVMDSTMDAKVKSMVGDCAIDAYCQTKKFAEEYNDEVNYCNSLIM